MPEQFNRREELIAAAAAGDLSPGEHEEFEALCAEDPSARQELRDLTELLPSLRDAASQWQEQQPSAELGESVRHIPHRGVRRRRAVLAAAVAASLIAGSAITLGIQHLIEAPPDGPPGTYGVVEEVAFAGEPIDVDIDGALIAHTWGTETVLEIEGLEPGESFAVVLVSEEGDRYESGTFLGSDILIECRMNAAVMRDEVSSLEITDDVGEVVVSAELPAAIDPEADDS